MRPAPRPKTLWSLLPAAMALSFGPSADTHFAMTASALRPLFHCSLPEWPRFVRTHQLAGFSTVGVATARPYGRSALLPIGASVGRLDSSSRRRQVAPGDQFHPCRGDTSVTPLLGGRRNSPSALLRTRYGSLSALALETAGADSRAPRDASNCPKAGGKANGMVAWLQRIAVQAMQFPAPREGNRTAWFRVNTASRFRSPGRRTRPAFH